MKDVKYVVVNLGGTFELPIVFPNSIQHTDVRIVGEIVSAGFVSIFNDFDGSLQAKVYGKSISLGLEARPEKDEMLIRRHILMLNRS